jgi:predicted nucleotidyltransferase
MAGERRLAVKKVKLTSKERSALQKFVKYLQQINSIMVRRIALYGSKARGDSQRDSDIDVLVILDQDDRELRREILVQAARISLEYDVLLSPRVIGEPRWHQMSGFSIYKNVINEAAGLSLVSDELVIDLEVGLQ